MQDDDGEIRPIPLADTRGELDGDAQALVAATFTLMTAYALAEEDGERVSTATQISDNLQALDAFAGLGGDFRRICGRLQAIWAAQAA